MFIAYDFVKFERLIYKIFSIDFNTDTWTFFDVLVWSILDKCYHILDFHVLDFNPYFFTYETFEVADCDKLGFEFDKIRSGIASDIEEDAHLGAI